MASSAWVTERLWAGAESALKFKHIDWYVWAHTGHWVVTILILPYMSSLKLVTSKVVPSQIGGGDKGVNQP